MRADNLPNPAEIRLQTDSPQRARERGRRWTRRANQCAIAAACAAWSAGADVRADTVSFQDGVGGYASTRDTFLAQSAPTTIQGGLARSEWDNDDPAGTGQRNYALIRFDNIFGAAPGQVPAGATINSASLSYTINDVGDSGNVYEVLVDWTEAVTYNGFGGGSPGVQVGEYGAFIGSAPAGSLTTFSVNVTASVAAWSANPAANRGWIVIPTNSNGAEFRSREYATNILQRPKLTVTFNSGAVPPTLTRRPYLQLGTPDSVVIAWRTNVAVDSRVRYGDAPTNLTETVTDSALVTDHFVTLSDLSPGTRYYYEVGTTAAALAGADANHYADTPPVAGTEQAFTAWIVGDSGTGAAPQLAVRNAMLANTGATPPDIFLHMGDIAYNSGTDTEFTNFFFAPYQDILRNTVCWPTLGNHEGASSQSATQTGPYYAGYVLPAGAQAGGVPSGTEAYYSFDYANAHFVCLDSHDSNRSVGGPMLTWLAADLAATSQDWLIAFWHHPPYSKGSHDSDNPADSGGRLKDMRENALPILEAGGVDLVLGGHSHIYERSYLVDGAYDTPTTAAGHIVDGGSGRPETTGAYQKITGLGAHEGAVYVVAGHGGASLGGTGGHPLMFFSELAYGSCILTINGQTLSLRNVRSDGAVTDSFSIVKSPLIGDIDADHDRDATDLSLFVQVVLGLDNDVGRVVRSDLNGNSAADADDIQPFVDVYAGP